MKKLHLRPLHVSIATGHRYLILPPTYMHPLLPKAFALMYYVSMRSKNTT